MNRTDDDLRTLLRTAIDPSASQRVLAHVTAIAAARPSARRSGPPPRRGRIGLATALVLVVVVGALTAVLTARTANRATPTPVGSAAPTTASSPVASPSPTSSTTPAVSTAAPGPVAGIVVSFLAGSDYQRGGTDLSPGEERVDAVPNGSTTPVASVHVGAATLTPDPGKPPVTLPDGGAATWATPPGGTAGSVLTWSVDGLTVTVSPPGAAVDDATVAAVAQAVLVGAPEPLPVPVSISAWPAAGWAVTRLVSANDAGGATATPPRDVLLDLSPSASGGPTVSVDSSGDATGTTVGTPEQIGGRTWVWDSTGRYTWRGADRYVTVTAADGRVGRDVLRRLIATLTPASSFADESTWFESDTAFPAS